MHKHITFTILAIALISTGCAAGLSNAERMELERLRSADQAARVERAKEDGYRPSGAPQPPATSQTTPDASGIPADGGGYVAASAVARGKPQAYLCVVGTQPRHVTNGQKLKIVNHVCDGGSRNSGSNCADMDGSGSVDFNSALSLEVDGIPVVTDGPGGYLMPNQTCYVEFGRTRQVTLTVSKHRVNGTRFSREIDPTPDPGGSYSMTIGLDGNNITLHDVDELRF